MKENIYDMGEDPKRINCHRDGNQFTNLSFVRQEAPSRVHHAQSENDMLPRKPVIATVVQLVLCVLTSLTMSMVSIAMLVQLRQDTMNSQEELSKNTETLKSTVQQLSSDSVLLNSTVQQLASDNDELFQLALGIRLAGGGRVYGRVELFYNGEWGTICDDFWGIEDATVICRMLGYDQALYALGGAHYGEGTGPIWLDNVTCTGTEPTILRCEKSPWGTNNCFHAEDAAVFCF